MVLGVGEETLSMTGNLPMPVYLKLCSRGGVSEEDLTHNHVYETLTVGRYT